MQLLPREHSTVPMQVTYNLKIEMCGFFFRFEYLYYWWIFDISYINADGMIIVRSLRNNVFIAETRRAADCNVFVYISGLGNGRYGECNFLFIKLSPVNWKLMLFIYFNDNFTIFLFRSMTFRYRVSRS